MIIGFTGTKDGMNDEQKNNIQFFLLKYKNQIKEVHHGDCIGADADFDAICKSMGIKRVIHPPINPKCRAFCESKNIWREREYLSRNKDIVDCCTTLIGTPNGLREQIRSGTWSTIRYADKRCKNINIYHIDGQILNFQNEEINNLW